jgi:hypothetical protein
MMSASTSSESTQPGFEQSGGEALAGLIERVHASFGYARGYRRLTF